MTYPRTLVVALATIVGTLLLGWWFVAPVGAVAGWVVPRARAAALEAGTGAALGWAVILGASALRGPVWTVAERVGPVFGVPSGAFVAIALAFPALLAASAALMVGDLRR